MKCGRLVKCGYEEHVKDICEDLFKDWSEYHPQTDTNPNAAADAFLSEGRGFDISNLIGKYTQQFYKDPNTGESSATVRFPLDDKNYWERLIDRPERFGNKKHALTLVLKMPVKPGQHMNWMNFAVSVKQVKRSGSPKESLMLFH